MRLVFLALMLSACATGPAIYSRAEGGTDEQLQRDLADCRAKSAMIPTPSRDGETNGFALYARRVQFDQDCMRARGWVRQR